jgi:hypothetical protein
MLAQAEITALRDIAQTASMNAASVKFGGGGVAASRFARARPRPKPGRSREAGAHLTMILSLLNERSNWSAMFLKAMETDCVGVWTEVG